MSRTRRARQEAKKSIQKAPVAQVDEQPPVARARLWLAAAFLLPNLGALACGFLQDDLPVLVGNESLHVRSLRQLAHIWLSGYWPSQRGPALYRPVTQTLWALAWLVAGERAWFFHAICLALGLAVVLMLYRFLLEVHTPPRTALIAALLFALFPIHTEATTTVVGAAELMAAALGLGALICFYRRLPFPALALFALAVFSKESAASFAFVPLAFPPPREGKSWRSRHALIAAAGAGIVIAAALFAHHALPQGPVRPFLDNPLGPLAVFPRVLTALWVQCLYVFKTMVPITLSSDYSYNQIPVVMGLDDPRAWAGMALACGAVFVALRWRQFRAPVLVYALLFGSTANLLFPIGTIMGERLAYAPTIGLALLAAMLLAPLPEWKIVCVAVALLFGARTADRNLDWLDSGRFYARQLETSPGSAKSWNNYGTLLASRDDHQGAIAAYERALAIFPDYWDAHNNRGRMLGQMGRTGEAIVEFRKALAINPAAAEVRNNLGAALSIQGQYESAVAEFRQALAIDPKNVEAHANLGVALMNLGRPGDAIAEFRQTAALDPAMAAAHFNLGLALSDQGQSDSAISEFRQAIALNPGFTPARENLQRLLDQKKMGTTGATHASQP